MSNKMKIFQRPVIEDIEKRVREKRRFIQVITGPRQVGKTTLVLQLLDKCGIPSKYISADSNETGGSAWLEQEWETARILLKKNAASGFILAVDEIQKIENWSATVKRLWDEDTVSRLPLKVILTGSSRLLVQKGLTESLAGRFEITYMNHWSFSEMHDAFSWTADQYAWFGGYPGSASLIDDEQRWKRYIADAIIETSISRDILMLTRIDKPSLLRRMFELGCRYSGQELSFTKILGQLQDAGNTVTLSHYLSLLSSAGLLSGLEKYSGSVVRQRSSSPKFMVHNSALLSSMAQETLEEIKSKPDSWGRIVESAIGAHLIDGHLKGIYDLYYWRKGNDEVDFVIVKKGKITAIEVKSGKPGARTGVETFRRIYSPHRMILIGNKGIPWKEFLSLDLNDLF